MARTAKKTDTNGANLGFEAKQPGIGQRIDEAMLAIEAENPSLKGVLPKEYACPQLSAVMVGELIDLISGFAAMGMCSRRGAMSGRRR